MNIKGLKEYIKDLPDDMEVWVEWVSYLVEWLENAYVEGDLFVLQLAE